MLHLIDRDQCAPIQAFALDLKQFADDERHRVVAACYQTPDAAMMEGRKLLHGATDSCG
jgi:hypothetical protein